MEANNPEELEAAADDDSSVNHDDISSQSDDSGSTRFREEDSGGGEASDDDDDDAEEEEDRNQQQQWMEAENNPGMVVLDPLPTIMDRQDPLRMKITSEELRHALEIKDAIELDPELNNLSDFMYVQWAIVLGGDVDRAVERAHALQAFREEYDVQDSYLEGSRLLKWVLVDTTPGMMLSFGFNDNVGSYTFTYDLAYDTSPVFKTNESVRKWFSANYYSLSALAPDFESMRKGVTVIAEAAGMDWGAQRRDFMTKLRLFSTLISVYPFRTSFLFFHTGTIFNLFATMLKRTLPQEIRDRFKTGLNCDKRLDEIYLVPNLEIANQRSFQGLEDTLKLRYENESNFKLP